MILLAASCNKISSISGDQDSKGEVGTTLKGDFAGETEFEDGTSDFATVSIF